MVAARRRTAPHSAPPSESAVSARAVSWHPCRIVSLCGSWPAAATELAGYETRGRDPAGWLARSTGLRRRLWPRRPGCAPGADRGCHLRPPVVVWVRRLLIVGVPSVLPEACPLLVITVLRCLGRGQRITGRGALGSGFRARLRLFRLHPPPGLRAGRAGTGLPAGPLRRRRRRRWATPA